MNTQRFQFVIGLFVIAGTIGTFVVGLWLAGNSNQKVMIPYTIYFEESVSGLKIGSHVRYRGIRIGYVDEIKIKPDDPQLVFVRVKIEEQYPMREGDVATLKLEGITGTSYVNIEGAGQGTPIIKPDPDNPAVIPSQKSELVQVVQGVPDLIKQATIVTTRLSDLLNQSNREQVESILVNVNKLSEVLADQEESIGDVFTTVKKAGSEFIILSENLQQSLDRVDALIDQLNTTAENADQAIKGDFKELVSEWKETAVSYREVSASLNTILKTNEESIQHFSQEGLTELTLFLQEARILVAGMTRVLESLESSGARFLLDKHVPEVTPE